MRTVNVWPVETRGGARVRQYEPFDDGLKWRADEMARMEALVRVEAAAGCCYQPRNEEGTLEPRIDETLLRWAEAKQIVVNVDCSDYGPGAWIDEDLKGDEFLDAYREWRAGAPLSQSMVNRLKGKLLISSRPLSESHAVLIAEEVNQGNG